MEKSTEPTVEIIEEQIKILRKKYLVIDTGALIKGVKLEKYDAEIVTIEEVLKEVRDHQSRALIETPVYDISVRVPDKESLKEGIRGKHSLT